MDYLLKRWKKIMFMRVIAMIGLERLAHEVKRCQWYLLNTNIVVMWVGVRLFIYILGLLRFGQPLGVNLTLLILVWKI